MIHTADWLKIARVVRLSPPCLLVALHLHWRKGTDRFRYTVRAGRRPGWTVCRDLLLVSALISVYKCNEIRYTFNLIKVYEMDARMILGQGPVGLEKGKKETLIEVLEARFGTVPDDLVEGIQKIENRNRLKSLVHLAVSCEDMETFRKKYMMNN